MVAAEAQACGTPVVAFGRGALGEVIVDGVTGFLVAPDDIHAAADAVRRAAETLARGMPRPCRTPPRSRAEPGRSRTALPATGRRWRRGRGPMAEPRHWLAGRLAVVTGASRGIGAATAEAIAAAGAHVVLAARDHEALDGCRRTHPRQRRRGHAGADGREQGRRRRAPVRGRRRGGRSRGSRLRGRRADVRAVRARPRRRSGTETLEVNLTGSFLCCRAAFLAMRRCARGADRQHRLALRRLRHREVPGADRLQRLQVRSHRSHRGDRGRGQGARHQRHLRESGRRRHRDAASGESRAASRPHTRRRRRADRRAA